MIVYNILDGFVGLSLPEGIDPCLWKELLDFSLLGKARLEELPPGGCRILLSGNFTYYFLATDFLLCFITGSHVAHAGLELLLLPPPPEFQDYRPTSAHLA